MEIAGSFTVLSPSELLVVTGDSVQNELNGEGREDDAHDTRGDVHAAFAHQPDQTRAQVQRDERNQEYYGDSDPDRDEFLKVTTCLGSEQQDRCDRARTG